MALNKRQMRSKSGCCGMGVVEEELGVARVLREWRGAVVGMVCVYPGCEPAKRLLRGRWARGGFGLRGSSFRDRNLGIAEERDEKE